MLGVNKLVTIIRDSVHLKMDVDNFSPPLTYLLNYPNDQQY